MKVNKVFFVTALSLIAFQAMSPTELLVSTNSASRMPAAVAKKTPAKKRVVKKPVTSKEMKALQDKLALLEKDLKTKESLLDEKSKEIELLKNRKTEEKIESLTKLIADQKSDIDTLKADIKNSEVKVVEVRNNNNTEVEIVVCKSESKGEKLEADVKKLLEDKESVLKQVDGLKKENEDLKLKLIVPEVKSSVVAEVKPEVKAEAKSQNAEVIALMSQMTTMFSAQMQSQMQMQVQMMSMLSQMQNNRMPQMSPYAYGPSQFSIGQASGYPSAGSYGGYPTFNDGLGLGAMGIGISAPTSPWSDYQNPYSIMPSMSRQQLPTPADFGFSFNRPQGIQGFDFNQTPATSEQRLPEPQRQQLPFVASSISV